MYGKALVGLGSIIAIAGSLGAGFFVVEDRYAKDRDLTLVAVRLDQKILSDRIEQLGSRLWRLEEKYGTGCVNAEPVIKEECQQLKQQLEQAKRDYDKQR